MRSDCGDVKSDALTGRVSGHLGEWLQGRWGKDGPVVLVTLACKALYAQATMTPDNNLRLNTIGPEAVTVTQLARLLRETNRPEIGNFTVSSNLPLGVGAGSSTAGLMALARAAGANDHLLASACLSIEGATDPLTLSEPDSVLWSSRQAAISAQFKAPPRCEIVGGYFGDPIRTDANDSNFPDISDLLPAWRDATEATDLGTLAALATQSAERTTRLRGPVGDPSPQIARDLGALGYARAHTGSARAFIFSPGAAPAEAEGVLKRAGLVGAFRFFTGSGS